MTTATLANLADAKPACCKPVWIDGIMQECLRELTAPAIAAVNGVALRLPAGCRVSILGGGSGGAEGKLQTIVEFADESGRRQRSQQGMECRFPAGLA